MNWARAVWRDLWAEPRCLQCSLHATEIERLKDLACILEQQAVAHHMTMLQLTVEVERLHMVAARRGGALRAPPDDEDRQES